MSNINKELKYAQSKLTEGVIRRFWKAMTLCFPAMCVNDGISIEYHEHLQQYNINQMVDKLTRCKSSHVACPLFQYQYEPGNPTPHHVSAITLTQTPSYIVLSFFDPKGKGSVRPREEYLLMNVLAKAIEKKTHKKVKLNIYSGENLQKKDDIGLCQLFSLFYLYEYMTEINKLTSSQSPSLATLTNPDAMVPYIRKKRNGFSDRTLYSFWMGYFQTLQKK